MPFERDAHDPSDQIGFFAKKVSEVRVIASSTPEVLKRIKNVCESISGVNLSRFFNQWLNGTGKIELNYKWNSKRIANEFETLIMLEQIQDGYEEYFFHLGITFKYDNGEIENFRFNINSKNVELSVRSNKKPVEIILDPNGWLLMTVNELTEN